ncbi:uncharacterized protein LOC124980860 isoform X1 [Sciurus carolinensis]|uniref:uncharacterized protein LOC124980860 isoform X1 n=1 Tax=Sciurus carolinensis TaxID=30640 RepID=UPI001FB28119|nr:uncharacterized protein LOC124980860 isoform X1 [Sciurus carolinensis]
MTPRSCLYQQPVPLDLPEWTYTTAAPDHGELRSASLVTSVLLWVSRSKSSEDRALQGHFLRLRPAGARSLRLVRHPTWPAKSRGLVASRLALAPCAAHTAEHQLCTATGAPPDWAQVVLRAGDRTGAAVQPGITAPGAVDGQTGWGSGKAFQGGDDPAGVKPRSRRKGCRRWSPRSQEHSTVAPWPAAAATPGLLLLLASDPACGPGPGGQQPEQVSSACPACCRACSGAAAAHLSLLPLPVLPSEGRVVWAALPTGDVQGGRPTGALVLLPFASVRCQPAASPSAPPAGTRLPVTRAHVGACALHRAVAS